MKKAGYLPRMPETRSVCAVLDGNSHGK